MDDRSLGAKGNQAKEDLEKGLESTRKFDASVGCVENAAKRQNWSRVTHDRVEHLGMTCVLSDEGAPILPRGGWEKISNAVAVLASLPGAAAVGERLAATYIRPLWLWACPLLAPVPGQIPARLFRAVLRSSCSWWCQGRWWAQRVRLRPPFSVAIQAAKAFKNDNMVLSGFAATALRAHFALLGMDVLE